MFILQNSRVIKKYIMRPSIFKKYIMITFQFSNIFKKVYYITISVFSLISKSVWGEYNFGNNNNNNNHINCGAKKSNIANYNITLFLFIEFLTFSPTQIF